MVRTNSTGCPCQGVSSYSWDSLTMLMPAVREAVRRHLSGPAARTGAGTTRRSPSCAAKASVDGPTTRPAAAPKPSTSSSTHCLPNGQRGIQLGLHTEGEPGRGGVAAIGATLRPVRRAASGDNSVLWNVGALSYGQAGHAGWACGVGGAGCCARLRIRTVSVPAQPARVPKTSAADTPEPTET